MNRCHAKNSRLAQREFLFHSDRVLETDAVVCAFIWRSVPGTVIFWHHLLLGWHLESLGLVSCMYSVVKGHHHEETPLFHPGEVCQGPTGCYFVCLRNLYLLRHRRGVKGFYRRGRISCVEAITDGPSTPLCYSSSNIWESAYIPFSLYYIQPRQTWPDKIQWSPSKAEVSGSASGWPSIKVTRPQLRIGFNDMSRGASKLHKGSHKLQGCFKGSFFTSNLDSLAGQGVTWPQV